MTQLKVENHNSVTLLNRLRIATRSTTTRERKGVFRGLSEALKGLGMIEAKGKVEGIYEGIDAGGNHWFMVELEEPRAQLSGHAAGAPPGGSAPPVRTLPPEVERDFTKRFENAQAADYYLQALYTAMQDNGWAFSGAAPADQGSVRLGTSQPERCRDTECPQATGPIHYHK